MHTHTTIVHPTAVTYLIKWRYFQSSLENRDNKGSQMRMVLFEEQKPKK